MAKPHDCNGRSITVYVYNIVRSDWCLKKRLLGLLPLVMNDAASSAVRDSLMILQSRVKVSCIAADRDR